MADKIWRGDASRIVFAVDGDKVSVDGYAELPMPAGCQRAFALPLAINEGLELYKVEEGDAHLRVFFREVAFSWVLEERYFEGYMACLFYSLEEFSREYIGYDFPMEDYLEGNLD